MARFVERLLSVGGIFIRTGSCALCLAYVACGRLNAYYEPHINSWDVMAAYLLVREAGGWTNDFLTEDVLTKGGPIAAAAPVLAAQFQVIIDH